MCTARQNMPQVGTLSHLSIHSVGNPNSVMTLFALLGAASLRLFHFFFFHNGLLRPVPTDQMSGRKHLQLVLSGDIDWHGHGHITLISLCSNLLHSCKFYTDFPLCFYWWDLRTLFLAALSHIVRTKSDAFHFFLLKEKVILIPLLIKM